jgi:hypothetical protein
MRCQGYDLCRYHGQKVVLYFLAEKSIMTNLASEEIDARCDNGA